MRLDKYARDWRLWRDWGAIQLAAAKRLFVPNDPFLLFPAATLGHNALEMYLKSALIVHGMVAANPDDAKTLGIPKSDCAWGHSLVKLAQQLAAREPRFDLKKKLPVVGYITVKEPITVEKGLSIFDPFFFDLRYPKEMKGDGPGTADGALLRVLARELAHARFAWNKTP